MSYLRALWITEATAAILLVICALIFATISAATTGPTDIFTPGGAAAAVFIYTLIIGVIPALLFAAPIYALLRSFNLHRVWIAALLGSIPAACISVIEPPFTPYAVTAALIVSFGTHFITAKVKS